MEGMLMLLVMMIITMVLTWALNGEQRKRAVSLLLCAAMMSSYIPAINVARADSAAKPVLVNERVLVNGTKAAQIGAVTYSETGSAYTLDTSSARVRVKNGDSISFDGAISAPEGETISWVRVDIYDANTEEPYTVGAEYYRASGMKVQEFDLASIPSLTVGEAFGSKDYTLAEGGKYIVMFCVGDSNGNTFADMDADIEDDQGPAILLDVKLSPSNCDHPHDDYRYVRHSSGEIRRHSYGDGLTHQVEPLYERYCGLCDIFLMDIWGQGTPEEHTFDENGVCLACGYTDVTGVNMFALSRATNPTITTLEPENVDLTSATLCGKLVDEGGYDVDWYYFAYREEGGTWAFTEIQMEDLANGDIVEQELEGLEQGTIYEYQFQVGNSQLGQVVAYGDTKEFTTDVESVQLDTPVLDETDYEVYVGETLTISWDPVDNATEYTIYIYDNNDVCETIEDCSYEYEFDQEGVYSIAVYATCSDNRDVYMQSEAGTANVTVTECDHNYLEYVTEDEWGYDRNDYEEHWHYQEITYTCEDCGHSYDDEIEDYFEHEWDAATSECDVCGCVLPELTIENFTVEEEYQLGDTFEFSGKIKGNGSDIARVSINVKRPGGASITHLDSTKVGNTEYDLKLVDDIELDKPGEYQIFIWATDVAGNGLNSADAVPGDGTFVYSFDVVYDISVDTIDTSDEATMNTVLMKGRLNISGDQNAITGFEHWGSDGEKIETLLSASCYDGDVFEWTLTDLKPDTEYSFRAVAKDYMRPIGNGDYERVYGEVVTVRTKAESEYCPQVETLSASDIDEYSAVIHAELHYTADVETEYGFIIGGANSTVTSTIIVGTDTDVTEYSYEWTGLEPDYKYSYQAYAKNEYGTVYGEEYGFTTDEVIQIQLDSPVLNTEENGSYSVDVGESLTISWDPVENATEYSVFIWQDGREITRSIEQRACSYEYTFDTAGTYVVGVYAMNSAKAYKYLQSETGANIYVSDVAEDTEAPMIENIVSNPESPIVVGTTVTFTTRVFDDMGLARAEWYIGEDCKYTEDLEGLVQTISFETSELTVGENKITVTAVDAAGWRTSHSLTVTVTEAEELVNASVDFEVAEDTVVIGESVTLDGAASSGDYYLKKIQVAVFTDEAKGHGYLSSAVKEFKYEDAVTEFDLSTIGNVEIKKTFNCTGHPELETQPQEDFPAGESWVGVYVSVYGVDGDEASNLFGASAFAPVKTTRKAETVTLEAEPSGEIAANTTVKFTAQSNSDEVTLCIKTLNDVENEWYTIEKPMKKSETEEGVFTAENQFLDGGTKYIWAQTADGTKSNEVEITVIAAAVKLSVPKYTGVEAAVVEEKAVLSWETVENADRYTAYLSLGTGENNRIELTNLINNEQINYTFTEAGTYCLMIYACGAEGSQYGTSDPCVVNIVVSEKEAAIDKKSPEINPITSTVASPITAGTEVTFSTTAADDVELAKIELFIDGELKKTETVSGLSGTISYTTSALAIGDRTVMVVATDASGLTNNVSLTVTVQKADFSTCAHLNTTVIPDPQYVSINAEQHKLVYTYWTHCLDCNTGLSNVQDEDLPERHTWKDGACEKCKHACGHNFEFVVNEKGENVAVVGSGKWLRQDDDYHVCTEIKYQTKCSTCGLAGESDYKPAGWTEKHDYKWAAGGVDRNDVQHRFYEEHICSLAACGDKKTIGEWENHQYVNGVCACGQKEKVTSSGTMNNSSSVINGSGDEFVDASDFEFSIKDGYYYPDRQMLIVHDDKIKVEVRDQYTNKIVNVAKLDYVKVELEVLIGSVRYDNGYIYLTSNGLEAVSGAMLRLIDVRDGSVIDEVYVGSCIAGNADAEGYMTLDALVEHSNKKVWAGEQGTQIAETIKVFDTEYQFKNDKPNQYPDGYYVVKLDAYNSSPLIYGVRVYNADGTARDGVQCIDGYTQNISLWRQGKEIISSDWANITDGRWGEFTGETEIMRQKTELCIEVPVGGALEFVQASEDDEVNWMNMLNMFLTTYALGGGIKDFVIPGVEASSVIDVNKVSRILSAAAKEEMSGIILDAAVSGSLPALLKEWCEEDERPEYVEELFKALGEGVVSGAIDEAEEWLEFFIMPPAYVIMEGGDIVAKGLDVTYIGAAINQQIENDKDYVFTDYIFTPYSD